MHSSGRHPRDLSTATASVFSKNGRTSVSLQSFSFLQETLLALERCDNQTRLSL